MLRVSSVSDLNYNKFTALCKEKLIKNQTKSNNETNLNLQPNSYPISFSGLFPSEKTVPEIVQAGSKVFLYNEKNFKISDIIDGPIENRYVTGRCNAKFKEEIGATPLPIVEQTRSRLLEISNFCYPMGTIAIPTTLDNGITTSDLWQCVGIAVIDKKHNLQTLIHFCPTVDENANKKVLNYVLNASNPKDTEIILVPGCYEETDKTLVHVVDILEKFQETKKSKIKSLKFQYFPKEKHTALVLDNGKLSCAKVDDLGTCDINPRDKIIYTQISKI